ncbi:FMN reductase [Corynebacterium cystitidis]|uniref:FMN reductase n=1 Tax=Corynebacterium cystitidis TaxID=35757 RepID=UPI00211E269E|nr:FMN reductase [Corynebacterium cystitidis]
MRQLTVVSAGLSNPSSTRSVADAISSAVNAAVSARGEALKIHTVELREIVKDLATVFTTGLSSPRLDEIKKQLSASDGLVAVTPIFKASYSGLFKMFFDALDQDALNGMPTIIAATAGTPRHTLATEYALRPLFTYMRAVVVPTSLFAATDDFGGDEGISFEKRVARAAGELADLIVSAGDYSPGLGGATVETSRRPRKTGVDLEEDLVPLEELLRGRDGNN